MKVLRLLLLCFVLSLSVNGQTKQIVLGNPSNAVPKTDAPDNYLCFTTAISFRITVLVELQIG